MGKIYSAYKLSSRKKKTILTYVVLHFSKRLLNIKCIKLEVIERFNCYQMHFKINEETESTTKHILKFEVGVHF